MSQAPLSSTKSIVVPEVLEALAQKVRSRPDWESKLSAARNWASAYAKNKIERTREKSLQATFLQRIFIDVLGYLDQGRGPGYWTLEAEPSTEIDSRSPDGRFGFFTPDTPPVTRAVIELKDALTELDAKQMGRRDRLSPVEQAFLYLIRYEEASFAIVSNFRSLRLYARRFGMARYQELDLTRLSDPRELSALIALCGSETLVGEELSRPSPLDSLLAGALPRPQQEITEEFYKKYADCRDRLVHYIVERFPGLRKEAVTYSQKLLDRILFILYAQARNFLPPRILGRTIDHALKSRSRSPFKVWEELLLLFEDIDKGREDHYPTINRYNGGLFAHDPVLDRSLKIPNELVMDLQQLETFDFESEIDVNVLGHVFESSIADIELLRRALSPGSDEVEGIGMAADSQRRDLGIYYTPSWVTHFIVDQTLGRFLQDHGSESRKKVKILDPACGSGAFLSEALSYLGNYSRMLAARASGASAWIGPDGIFKRHGRGEELGSDSFVVQCPSCFSWSIGPRSRAQRRGGGFEDKTCRECGLVFTVDQALAVKKPVFPIYQPEASKQVALFSGEQVNRYWTASPLGLELSVPGIPYKDDDLYLPPKLLIRQTSIGIYATIDHSNARCTQSVYVYKRGQDDPVALEFYLAQLNSRAMLFYYFILTNQIEWQSFPKLTHETLQKLPLRRPDLTRKEIRTLHDTVVDLVKRRMSLAARELDKGPTKEALDVDLEIERNVMDFCDLTPDQRLRISERLRPSQNIRIIRELYPPPDQLLAGLRSGS